MEYYTDWVAKLTAHGKMIHDKDKYDMLDWVLERKEDFDSFVFNYMTIDETASGESFNIMMANYWFAVALIAHELGWDY